MHKHKALINLVFHQAIFENRALLDTAFGLARKPYYCLAVSLENNDLSLVYHFIFSAAIEAWCFA